MIAITADFSRGPSSVRFASLLQHLGDFAPQTLAAMKLDAPGGSLSAVLLRSYLVLPAFMSLGLSGLFLLWVGRRRHQVRIFAN